mmetsp:Transcript_32048/g.77876  ORF Transcript_32048/g.77876 Transcript_32048/m.77876 type:complete len:119 (+) Transcript_32048:233-589(+)
MSYQQLSVSILVTVPVPSDRDEVALPFELADRSLFFDEFECFLEASQLAMVLEKRLESLAFAITLSLQRSSMVPSFLAIQLTAVKVETSIRIVRVTAILVHHDISLIHSKEKEAYIRL